VSTQRPIGVLPEAVFLHARWCVIGNSPLASKRMMLPGIAHHPEGFQSFRDLVPPHQRLGPQLSKAALEL